MAESTQSTYKNIEGIGHSEDSGFASIAGSSDNGKASVNYDDVKFASLPVEEGTAAMKRKQKALEIREEKRKEDEEYQRQRQEAIYKRLTHLVTKSKFYSGYLLGKVDPSKLNSAQDEVKEKGKGKQKGKGKRKDRKKAVEENDDDDYSPPAKKTKTRTIKASRHLKDYVTDDIKEKAEKKMNLSEEDIEKELSTESDEETDEANPDEPEDIPLKYFVGELRDYQKKGLKWLILLYQNGLNGILADEMGLGKTIQVIALLCYLIEKRQSGPFLIIAPLSTLPNWIMEFERFAPKLPLVVLHGRLDQRKPILAQIKQTVSLPDGFRTPPIVLTTFDMPLRDAPELRKHIWRYIAIDEGHRIKNHEAQLSKVVRSLKSISRLILTGTPLQNNLAELWALLNFLLPDIFNDLAVFESWFDVKELQDAEGTKKFLKQEEDKRVIASLREILKPFMLRREKTDVCTDIPAKKEIIIYTPITELQRDLYIAVLNRDYEELAMKKTESLIIEDVNGRRPKRKCTMKNKYSSTYSDPFAAFHGTKSSGSSASSTISNQSDKDYKPMDEDEEMLALPPNNKANLDYYMNPASPASSTGSNEQNNNYKAIANGKLKNNYQEIKHNQMYSLSNESLLNNTVDQFDQSVESYQNYKEQDNTLLHNMLGSSNTNDQEKTVDKWAKFANINDRNVNYFIRIRTGVQIPLYKQIINHPYLIHCPLDYSGLPKIDEDLVKASGKLLVLDRMLKKLHSQGHKVLLFSTMTMILDIIADYLNMRPWKFVMLDGRIDIAQRRKDIAEFNTNPDVFIFLISTRAGGVGLNLTGADTVIMFDSDWNPQADLQAMARCHRIGQTKPVVIYRLCTKGTIDESILKRAEAKRKLEKMVISKKLEGFNLGKAENILELKQLLTSTENNVVTSENEVFTDAELDKLLDRSDLMPKN